MSGDAVEPGVDTALAPKVTQVLVSTQEYFLASFAGIIRIAQQIQSAPVYRRAIFLEKILEFNFHARMLASTAQFCQPEPSNG